MKYTHINDCWNELRKATTIEEVEKLFREFPRWSGDWDTYVEDNHLVVVNEVYDEYRETTDTYEETLDIEFEEELEYPWEKY